MNSLQTTSQAAQATSQAAQATPASASPSGTVVEIYTDGACRGNPGPGGWGALLRFKGQHKELRGGEAHTTNNRMELMAVISALQALTRPVGVCLYSDSKYVTEGITKLPEWKARGWKTASRKPIKNQDLWTLLDQLAETHPIECHWVAGHSGNEGNERADAIANQAIDALPA